MEISRKFFFFIASILVLFSIALMINAAINFRDYAYKNVIEKSKMTAEIVRDGLTAHMINGTMDKRAFFLRSISNTKDVKALWIVRGENVIKQYGEGLNSEKPKDEIDKRVLKTGKSIREIYEDTNKAILRVTIPYKATAYSHSNCLECHNVKEDETLGAISLEFDISDTRREGVYTLLKIAAITVVFLLITLVAVKIFIKPYLEFFENLQKSLKKARHGDFSLNVTTNIDTKDIQKVADLFNQLIEKFQKTIKAVESSLEILLKDSQNLDYNSKDPLEKASRSINMLSKINHFKNTIELDATLPQIYSRIAYILRSELKCENFIIYYIDSKENKKEIVHSTVKSNICSKESLENVTKCRAFSTKNSVYSDQFPELCPNYIGKFKFYYCIPYQITDDYTIVITLLSNSKDEIKSFKKHSLILNYYLENAKPVIESKLLMNQLHQQSLKDGLTGLYNRKFLEEFIDQATRQSERKKIHYGVLMIDIDFFKKVNDTFGHDAGDKFIQILAKIIKSSIRESDIATRYGGEEFVVLLYESSLEGAKKVAEKIRSSFEKEYIVVNGEKINKSLSVGIAYFPDMAKTIREAIKFADVALYKAKESSRNRVAIFDKSMYDEYSY